MPQRNSNDLIAGSISGRAEVMAAFDGLAEKVAHLALHVERIATLADKSKAEPVEGTVRVAADCAIERAEQLEGSRAATACDAMPEATNFLLSPPECGAAGEIVDEFSAKFEAEFTEPKGANSRVENTIAGRVLELHDRLGGFIKPPLPQPPDQDT